MKYFYVRASRKFLWISSKSWAVALQEGMKQRTEGTEVFSLPSRYYCLHMAHTLAIHQTSSQNLAESIPYVCKWWHILEENFLEICLISFWGAFPHVQMGRHQKGRMTELRSVGVCPGAKAVVASLVWVEVWNIYINICELLTEQWEE